MHAQQGIASHTGQLKHGTKRLVSASVCQVMPSVKSQLAMPAGTRDNPMPASGSFALRVLKQMRHCPVLLVKANSKGPYLRSDNGGMGKPVVTLQSSRCIGPVMRFLCSRCDCTTGCDCVARFSGYCQRLAWIDVEAVTANQQQQLYSRPCPLRSSPLAAIRRHSQPLRF